VSAALAQVPWQNLLAGGLVLGLLGIVGVGLRAILKGKLVPESVLKREADRADKWEQAWRESEARADAVDGRLQAIAEGTELNTQLLSQLLARAPR
jgi:hypothetical protein